MGQMFHITRDKMNNWRWDNHHAFGDQVDRSHPHTISSANVQRNCESSPWYGREDPRANIEASMCRQYKPGYVLPIGPLTWHEIIDEDDDDEHWVD